MYSDVTFRFLYILCVSDSVPAGIYLFKVNNRNKRIRCVICSKLTIKISELHHWLFFGVFIRNSEHISHFFWCFCCWLGTRKLPARTVHHFHISVVFIEGAQNFCVLVDNAISLSNVLKYPASTSRLLKSNKS